MRNQNSYKIHKKIETEIEHQFANSLRQMCMNGENELIDIVNYIYKGNRHYVSQIKYVVQSQETLIAKFYLHSSRQVFAQIKQIRYFPKVQKWE